MEESICETDDRADSNIHNIRTVINETVFRVIKSKVANSLESVRKG